MNNKKITIRELIKKSGRRLGGDCRLTVGDMMAMSDDQLLAIVIRGNRGNG
jgi:ABC-type uncharacterized transport system involved in gliding motility auxiliary subunit